MWHPTVIVTTFVVKAGAAICIFSKIQQITKLTFNNKKLKGATRFFHHTRCRIIFNFV